MKHKNFAVSELKMNLDEPGTFEALVSVFGNVDRGGDRVVPGAFARTLKQRGLPPVLWSHDWNTPPIAALIDARETDKGLLVKGQLFVKEGDDHEVARQVYTAMKATDGHGMPVLREFSFGYEVHDSEMVTDDDGATVRELKDIELFEVSPVVVGMNPATELIGVKNSSKCDCGCGCCGVQAKEAGEPEAKQIVALQELEVASAETQWDADGALARVTKWATRDDSGYPPVIDFRKFRRAFAWFDDRAPGDVSSYRLQIADVIDGDLKLVPAAVAAAASALDDAGIDEGDLGVVKSNIDAYQSRIDAVADPKSAGAVTDNVPTITPEHAARLAELRNM